MQTWVAELTQQIEEIDQFFVEQFEEKVDYFIKMQAKYLNKLRNEIIVQAEEDGEDSDGKKGK